MDAVKDPVIVVGMNRSGTKWLSNMLCNHPEITGILADHHFGILETNMLSALHQRFPDLRAEDDYRALVACWTAGDFYRLTGLPPAFCYDLTPRPTTCPELLARVMSEVADRAGSRYWTVKVSPHFAADITRHYPGARVIVIERDLMATIKSHMVLLAERVGPKELLRNVLSYAVQARASRVLVRAGAHFVRFEDLKRDTAGGLRAVCAYLDLPYREDLAVTTFARNTSFTGDTRREGVFTARDARLVRLFARMVALLPDGLLRRIYGRHTRGRLMPMMPGTYRMDTRAREAATAEVGGSER